MNILTENRIKELEDIDPKNLSDDKVYDGTLEWVNIIRSKYNLPSIDKLPQGRPEHSYDCALARALRGLTDYSCNYEFPGRHDHAGEDGTALLQFAFDGQVQKIITPKIVGQFIYRFDNLHYPDLVTWK